MTGITGSLYETPDAVTLDLLVRGIMSNRGEEIGEGVDQLLDRRANLGQRILRLRNIIDNRLK
jgi:hypothetical protein